jgi:hypothetical protein
MNLCETAYNVCKPRIKKQALQAMIVSNVLHAMQAMLATIASNLWMHCKQAMLATIASNLWMHCKQAMLATIPSNPWKHHKQSITRRKKQDKHKKLLLQSVIELHLLRGT